MAPPDKNSNENSQMQKFGEILQKFGLDLIQSIGEMKHNLSILTGKIEKIEKELIELKGIKNQLQENSRLREEFVGITAKMEKQLRLLHSKFDQYEQFSSPPQNNHVQLNKSSTSTSSSDDPVEIISDYQAQIDSLTNFSDLIQLVKKMKEQIYLATGGHKILLELRTYRLALEKDSGNADWEDTRIDFISRMEAWKSSL
ncbi:MAG: hypothetical protein ACTSYI_14090 [Promethearchaeota archaeon]